MFTYVCLGTNDLPRAIRFYDALLGALDVQRCDDTGNADDPHWPGWAGWGVYQDQGQHEIALWVGAPFNGKAATIGNGTMVALRALSWAQVDAFHAEAIENGGSSEGAPALRPQYNQDFYAAYVRDPDGNKLAAICRGFTQRSEVANPVKTESAAGIKLRAATPNDVTTIIELIRELAIFEKLANQVIATPALLHEHLFGPRPYAEVLLAEWQGKVAGFALFFHNYSTFLTRPGVFLEDLYVRESLRGHGIGKALLTAVAETAATRGCGRMEWSVLNWNLRAIEFYQSMGAKPMDEWTLYRLDGEALARFKR
jgi:GNAT superfamily N-acetyltransferase/catechol 2,3-dioxygenase-like lactoylglutathione lyase family enzyme